MASSDNWRWLELHGWSCLEVKIPSVNWLIGGKGLLDSTRPTAEVSLRGDKKVRGTLPFF